ncbi:MAG: APC family permease [Alphaproteobacteria bacterium]|nr:APC family permease [Alphaproteobacteria bacterium]
MSEESDLGLKRTLGFWALVAYGAGDIMGAGIYALMGEVAAVAGYYSWLAFAVAMLAAGITALSYSELVTRYPRSGGEAYYCEKGFRRKSIPTVIGWLVFCAGTLSLSAISVAFAGYLSPFLPDVPKWVMVAGFLLFLGAINFWGIRQSSIANIVCTVIEATGLLIVIVVGLVFLFGSPSPEAPASTSGSVGPFSLTEIMQGGALAFFAFIGFQDMINIAEEVKEPEKIFPKAIISALLVAGSAYIVIALIATQVVEPSVLGQSDAPLMRVVSEATGGNLEFLFTLIALFAVANTGLLNFIMASRLLYGMSNQKLVPEPLSRVSRRRRTPHFSIMVVLAAALILSLSGTLAYLAGSTSTLLLVVFLMVNLALLAIKRRQPDGRGGFRVPFLIPLLGVLTTASLIAFAELSALMTTLGLAAVGAALFCLRQVTASSS